MGRIGADRIGGAAGLLYVALFMISIPLSLGEPGFDASARTWLAWYHASHNAVVLGAFEAVTLPCFVMFLAGIWVSLRSANDHLGAVLVVLLVGGAATLAMHMASGAANEAAAIRVDRGLDLSEAGALADMATGFFVMSWIGLATVLLGAGVGIIASRTFPRWLGWTALVIGTTHLGAVVVPLAALGFIALFAFYLWVVLVSAVMLLRARLPHPAGKVGLEQ